MAVGQSHGIAMDIQGKIEKEYELPRQQIAVIGLWFSHLQSIEGKICRLDSRVFNKNRRKLRESLHFHDDDMVYVGVACKTPDKLIVSEDRSSGDFDECVCQYLNEALGITVLHIAEACDKA